MIIEKIVSRSILLLALLGLTVVALSPISMATASNTVGVWWPTSGAHMQSTQPFKAMVDGLDVSHYEMSWQVDGGQLNRMSNNYVDYQHKEASVDLTNWTWRGSGPYVVTFVAQQGGATVAQQSVPIYVDNGLPVSGASAPAQEPVTISATAPVLQSAPASKPSLQVQIASAAVIPSSSTASLNNGLQLYVDPNSNAAKQASAWASSNPTGAAAMQALAAQPTAVWLGNWNSNIQNDARTLVTSAAAQGATPVMIAYNIPQRDCGGFSAGGSNNPEGYTSWIQSLAAGIGSAKAVIVLEPDALSQISCLSQSDQQTRLSLLSQAVTALKGNANTKVYLDAGHSGWIDAAAMSSLLSRANIANADGFALNVSNFMPTDSEVQYGQQISSQIGGKHFVVDTSRNGNGSNGQWCNPSGRAIGGKPTTQTGNALVDAFLWLKTPGESDGNCNGGPNAGVWWPEYALQLVQNAH